MKDIKTKAINDEIRAGDLVIATPDSEYAGLIGRVPCINPVGSDEHNQETENITDDVHVNFLEFNYSPKRIREIEAMFTELYGEKKKFDTCTLDDVIMMPCTLIRITGIDKKKLDSLLDNGINAVSFCFTVLRNMVYAAKNL